jgi:hypothetical protein
VSFFERLGSEEHLTRKQQGSKDGRQRPHFNAVIQDGETQPDKTESKVTQQEFA